MRYVIQTITSKEDELVFLIQKILSDALYERCFVLKAEWIKRLGGRWIRSQKTLFPGYVFIDTNNPEELFFELKQLPQFSKLLGKEEQEFVSLHEDEKEFLEMLLRDSQNYVIRPTIVEVSKTGKVISLEGVLQHFKSNLVKVNLRKRYAIIRIQLLGQTRTVLFGIQMKKDLGYNNTLFY